MRCVLALVPVLLGCLLGVSRGAEPASEEAVEEFKVLQEEYNAQQERYWELRNQAAENDAQDEDYEAIFAESSPQNTLAEKFLELESRCRGTIVGLSCLRHLLMPRNDIDPESPARIAELKATEILCEHYASDPNFDMIVYWWGFDSPRVDSEKERLFECGLNSPHKHVRASTLLKLARRSEDNCEMTQYFQGLKSLLTDADDGSPTANRVAKYEPMYREIDIDAERRRTLELIDVILKDYADIPSASSPGRSPALLEIERKPKSEQQPTYGERAARLKFELTRLAIGRKAPDIDEPDAFGEPLRLDDQRGKVTVLMFSFKGCGPCERMYPDNRKLIEEMEGRPFAFLGVMGDDRVETVHEAVESGKITWPVWWTGPERKLSNQWNVRGWPTIYVLDHTGTIRFRDVRHEMLRRAVHKLVAEAEAAE